MSQRPKLGLSFGTRHIFGFVALIAVLLGGWNWLFRWPSVSVSGTKLGDEQVIEIECEDEYPYALAVRITGKLDGRATITDPWGTTTTVGPGDLDLY